MLTREAIKKYTYLSLGDFIYYMLWYSCSNMFVYHLNTTEWKKTQNLQMYIYILFHYLVRTIMGKFYIA